MIAIILTSAAAAQALTLNATVNAQDGPWEYVNGGLNTNYQYGVDDQAAPLVVSSADGLAFTAGTTLDIEYVSGSSNEGGGFESPDANGDPGYLVNGNDGSRGKPAPSFFSIPLPIQRTSAS